MPWPPLRDIQVCCPSVPRLLPRLCCERGGGGRRARRSGSQRSDGPCPWDGDSVSDRRGGAGGTWDGSTLAFLRQTMSTHSPYRAAARLNAARSHARRSRATRPRGRRRRRGVVASPARGRGGYHTQGHAEARRARPLTDVAHFSWSSSHEKSEQRAQNRYLLRQLPAKRTASQVPDFLIEANLHRTEILQLLPRSLARPNHTTRQICH